MHMTRKEYAALAKKCSPNSRTGRNLFRAFVSGGLICCIGQILLALYSSAGLARDAAAAFTSVTMVLLGVLLTALGVYDKLAKFSGAGTLVPITGFANSIASPAMEFRTEGLVTGLAVKMFTIAGPVLVFGTSASIVYGLVYWITTVV